MTTKTEYKWYNYNKILSYNAMWNFIVGPRGNGKTYGAKKKAIKDFITRGHQFAYVRRFKEELQLSRDSFFADIEKANEFPDYDFRVVGKKAQIAPVETRDDDKRRWEDMGVFIPLSTAQSYKSVSFPGIRNLIFDEFILEKSNQQYLRNEASVFKNLYSTIDRNQDRVRVFFLANAVSIMNPYFIDLKIRPDGSDQYGRANKLDNGRFYVAYHFIKDEVYKEQVGESMFGQFISGSEYDSFANKSEFSDKTGALVEQKDPTARYFMTMLTPDGSFAIWRSAINNRFYVTLQRPVFEILVTTEIEWVNDDVSYLEYSDKRSQYLRNYFNTGKVKFENDEARNMFVHIYKRR